jgi:hypothetical protein
VGVLNQITINKNGLHTRQQILKINKMISEIPCQEFIRGVAGFVSPAPFIPAADC